MTRAPKQPRLKRAATAIDRAPAGRVYAAHSGHAIGLRCVVAGLALTSEANARDAWQKRRGKGGRHTTQKLATTAALRRDIGVRCPLALPLAVTITVVRPRRLDSDNAVGAAKYVRDSIAAWVGVDDGDARYTWVYRQRVGPHAVVIELAPCAAGDGAIVLPGGLS